MNKASSMLKFGDDRVYDYKKREFKAIKRTALGKFAHEPEDIMRS